MVVDGGGREPVCGSWGLSHGRCHGGRIERGLVRCSQPLPLESRGTSEVRMIERDLNMQLTSAMSDDSVSR